MQTSLLCSALLLTSSFYAVTLAAVMMVPQLEREELESSECPCSHRHLCKPIQGHSKHEVFGFLGQQPSGAVQDRYDFSQLSTVAWTEDPEIMCYAHSKGTRVIADGREGVIEALASTQSRNQWILDAVRQAKANHLDGINFDLEIPAKVNSALSKSYSALVSQAVEIFHRHISGSQVSVDLPWSPYDIDGRNYDWDGLVAAADMLFVMAYDMQSQIYGKCIASANSPASLVKRGLNQWIDLGARRDKLVLGLPWYAYDYPCQADASGNSMDPKGEVCHLAAVPFRGAPCSDAAGSQRTYWDIMEVLRSGHNTTDVMWDADQESPYFNYKADDGIIHQVWFDNPRSLSIKYQLAADLGIKGVGIWHLESLDYSSSDPDVQQQTADMWEALTVFTRPGEL